MGLRTPFYDLHVAAGAKMVDFGGWDMPLHYGSQLDEHHIVRKDAGFFDVSHMTILEVRGADAKAYLQHLLANDVDKLKQSGKALYSGMLNEQGKVVDDLIVYYRNDQYYRVVVNASTRDKDIAWMENQAQGFAVSVEHNRGLAMLAVQGPQAREKAHIALGKLATDGVKNLGVFFAEEVDGWFIARTGYTGEDGYEIMIPLQHIDSFWKALIAAGVAPCGLGARDTLRLEAGMNLYGSDMDETISPLEANMGWTIAWEPSTRNFVGRAAIAAEKAAGVKRKLVGLVISEKGGIPRGHQKVVLADGSEGEITSGTFSPTLQLGIAMARVPASVTDTVHVEIRGKLMPAKVVKVGFVRNGKSVL